MVIAGPCGIAARHGRYVWVLERDRADRLVVVIKTFAQSVSSSPEQPLHISLLRCSSPVSSAVIRVSVKFANREPEFSHCPGRRGCFYSVNPRPVGEVITLP